MSRVRRLPVRTQSCDVWSVKISFSFRCGSESILFMHYVFMMASEEKPLSHGCGRKRKERAHGVVRKCRCSQCCCFRKSDNDCLLKADFNVFCMTNPLLTNSEVLGISEVSMLNRFLIQLFASALRSIRGTAPSEKRITMMLFLTIEPWNLTASIQHVFSGKNKLYFSFSAACF